MKSIQVNFFLLPEELKEVERFLTEKGVIFIQLPVFNPDKISIKSISYPIPENLFLKVCLTGSNFFSQVELNKIEDQKYYLVDSIKSPVVEFSRCYYDSNPLILRRGRLYFTRSYYDEKNNLIEKSDDFLKWAKGILRDFRQKFLKHEIADSIYATDKVMVWMKEKKTELNKSGTEIILTESGA